MSVNTSNKRKAKARHRREFSAGVIEDWLNNVIWDIPPSSVPVFRLPPSTPTQKDTI